MREGGFTLMEMLVVLAIIGIVAAVAVPGLFQQPSGVARGRAIVELERHITTAADQARSSGRTIRLDLASEMPGTRWKPAIGTDTAALFYPDGSSNGGMLSLGSRSVLVISWLDSSVVKTGNAGANRKAVAAQM